MEMPTMDQKIETAISTYEKLRGDRQLAWQALQEPREKLHRLEAEIQKQEGILSDLTERPLEEALKAAEALAKAKFAFIKDSPSVVALGAKYENAVILENQAMKNLVQAHLVALEQKKAVI
jgi:hypothetical protein